jgi:predicted XRE-type DNA-binding protein
MSEDLLTNSIDDLIRLTVTLHSDGTTSDSVRRILNANIKQARIAKLLDIPASDVSSIANKQRKAAAKPRGGKKP